MTDRTDEYLDAHVQRLLAEDGGVAEQGIRAVRRDGTLVLCGTVESAARRDEIVRLVAGRFPDLRVESDIDIAKAHPPSDVEDLS